MVTKCIPIYSGVGKKPAIIIRQPLTEIQITDTERIVKNKAFFSKRPETLDYLYIKQGVA